MSDGQVVTLDEPTNVHEVHLLLAGDAGMFGFTTGIRSKV